MFKGNEKDCVCEKPRGKHRKYCDAYRLSVFLARANGAKIVRRCYIVRPSPRLFKTIRSGLALQETPHGGTR